MALPRKVLLVVSSYNEPFYPDGAKTGLFYTEGYHPYEEFTKHGFEVDLASETGTSGIDEHSTAEPFVTKEESEKVVNNPDHPFNVKLFKQLKKPSDINAKDYGIFFASGGHSTMYDYPTASGLQKIAGEIYDQGGVVSAVCHGPAILPGIKVNGGKSILEGKTITGFPTEGEVIMNIMDKLKQDNLVLMDEAAASAGAKFVNPPQPFDNFSQVDGRVVTGANPASAASTAKAAIGVFEKI
jgi:putative intracellular protease/amidase